MAPTRELGPWTLHGDLAYPTVTTDRFLRGRRRHLGRLRASPGRVTPPTTAGPGSPASDPVPNAQAAGALPPLAGGGRRRARRFSSRACPRCNSEARPSMPTTASGPGSSTSIWPTVSAPRAPKCRSSERTWVSSSTSGSIIAAGDGARLRAGHLGGRLRWLSIGRHCGRDGYGLGQAQRLNLRTVRSRAHESRRPRPRCARRHDGPRGRRARRLRPPACANGARRSSPAWKATISTR